MLAKVFSCAVIGLEAAIVEVEVDTANGLPSFVDVGSKSQRCSPVYGKAGEAGHKAQPRLRVSPTPFHRHADLQVMLGQHVGCFELHTRGLTSLNPEPVKKRRRSISISCPRSAAGQLHPAVPSGGYSLTEEQRERRNMFPSCCLFSGCAG